MKSLSITKLFTAILFVFLAGCSHDIGELNKDQSDSRLVEVKASEDQNLLDFIDATEQQLKATSGRTLSSIQGVDLSKALKRTAEDGKVTYSLHIEDENPFKLQNLVLEEGTEGTVSGALFEYDVDLNWLFELDEFPGWDVYTGIFRVRDLEGNLIYQTQIIDGNSPDAIQNDGGRTEGGYCVTTTETFCTYIESTGEILHCWQEIETVCYTDGGTDTNDKDPYLTGDGEDDLGGGGFPTETGIYDPGDEISFLSPKDWEDNINDSQLKPCMKALMGDVQNLTRGVATNVVMFSGGTLPNYNWTLKHGTLATSQNAATIQTYNGPVTTFDTNKFGDATDLSIIRTILHEAVHAFLIEFFRHDRVRANAEYSQLVQDYNELQSLNDAHHLTIATNFASNIAKSLKEYGESQGYQISDQYYNDLAWGGLEDTFYFTSKSSSEQRRIRNVIQTELTGRDTNGTSRSQKGKKAGC